MKSRETRGTLAACRDGSRMSSVIKAALGHARADDDALSGRSAPPTGLRSLSHRPRRGSWRRPAPPLSSAPVAAPSASAAPASASFDVRLKEHVVFTLRAARAGKSAQGLGRSARVRRSRERSTTPSSSLSRVEEEPGAAIVFVGKTPIITLGDEDATAAGGTSLSTSTRRPWPPF